VRQDNVKGPIQIDEVRFVSVEIRLVCGEQAEGWLCLNRDPADAVNLGESSLSPGKSPVANQAFFCPMKPWIRRHNSFSRRMMVPRSRRSPPDST
jgi:hypothetical protein